MRRNRRTRSVGGLVLAAATLVLGCVSLPAQGAPAKRPAPARSEPSDIPAAFVPPSFPTAYEKRDVMIPMRDGVRLHTVIVLPPGAANAPLVLDRTPYSATKYTSLSPSPQVGAPLPPLHGDLARAGYIVVLQDVRGKHGSEGTYVLTRAPSGPYNADAIDHATDAWDTIDWLVKHVPESNGRVATIGVSYDGWTALMSLLQPHPALKAAVPIDPMVDGWTGDDWYHNGAFRQMTMEYVYHQTTTRDQELPWPDLRYDAYGAWLAETSAGGMMAHVGMAELPFVRRLAAHRSFDDYWRSQALDRTFAGRAPPVPVLLVHSQWDQDDIYGAPALYAAMKAHDAANDRVHLTIGPWSHAQSVLGDGATLGPLVYGTRTAVWWRANVLIPFLDRNLRGGGPGAPLPAVSAYETGSNVWRSYDRWPQSCASGCPHASRPLYLRAGGALSFDPPVAGDAPFDEYVSDPRKPVTFRQRPIRPNYAPGGEYARWQTDDQRFAGARPDVLEYVSSVLTAPLRIAGQPVAHLHASTSGADTDWVVKLIDQYPDEVPDAPALGGYQLPIAMEILRARYRDDPAHPTPVPADALLAYTIRLPHANHVFLPGHRLVVQIQSAWFPLYDRNPQTWVEDIFHARPEDYRPATQRVAHRPHAASFVELPVAP